MSSREDDSFCKEKNFESFETKAENDRTFGPSLPPHFLDKIREQCEKKIYGPALPDNFRSMVKNETMEPEISDDLKERKSSEINSSDDSDGDGNVFGPSPTLMASDDFAKNYKSIRQGKGNPAEELASKEKTKKERESWMLELPSKKSANFSSESRRFRKRVNADDETEGESVWTETPETRRKKAVKNGKKAKSYDDILKTKMAEERNREMEILARKCSRKLDEKESLLEMHMKKMKKKKKEAKKEKSEGKMERRPFDRNIDLQVHRFDESKKKLFLNKAIGLNSRFASGENKFL